MSQPSHRKFAHSRQAIVSFVLACIAAWALELTAEHVLGHQGNLAGPLFNFGGIYQSLVTSGPRKPVQRFTVLIDTNAAEDRYFANLTDGVINPCDRRAALATLIRSVALARPSVIVLDYSFHARQCAQSDPSTETLRQTIAATSAAVPIVFGRRIGPDDTLNPTVEFPAGPDQQLKQALIEFDPDSRKLPLNWAVKPDKQGPRLDGCDNDDWCWIDTLSLAAAKSYNPQLQMKYVRLSTFLAGSAALPKQARHPYISFLTREEMTAYPAGQIVCGANYAAPAAGSAGTPCGNATDARATLRGKIVVIGEGTGSDRHDSVIGNVPGYVLQANYIEALLDERYFTPAPRAIDFLFGLFIFVALMAATEVPNGLLMTGLWAATLLVAYGIIYIAIMHFGYYTNPVAVSLFALVITTGHKIPHWIKPLGTKLFAFKMEKPP